MSCMRGGQKIYAWDENVSSFFFFFFERKVGLEGGSSSSFVMFVMSKDCVAASVGK